MAVLAVLTVVASKKQKNINLKRIYTVKKDYRFSVPSRDVTNQTPPGRELLNCSQPGRVWLVKSRLGAGNTITFFTVYSTVYLTGNASQEIWGLYYT